MGVVSRGTDTAPGRLSCCLSESGADGGCVLVLIEGTDICSPSAPTGGPEPLIVGVTTLAIEAAAEALGRGAIVDAFASLETGGPCTLTPLTG